MNGPVAGRSRKPLTPEQIRLIRRAGLASVAVALTLVVLKLFAWIATGSIAMLGSLADSALDLVASSVTLMAVRFALEPADREHRFGHGKLEAIAGLVQAVIILGSAIYVGLEAVLRLLAPMAVASPGLGSAVMFVSLALTVSLVLFQRFVTTQTGSIAIGADEVHYRADVLTNIAVLAALGASHWFGWYWADPALGLVVVAVILTSVRSMVLRSLDVLLDRELPSARRAAILQIAKQHSDVLGVHDLRTRSSGTHEFIQFHIELRPELSLHRVHGITEEIEAAVTASFPRSEVIIHADPYGIDEPQDSF